MERLLDVAARAAGYARVAANPRHKPAREFYADSALQWGEILVAACRQVCPHTKEKASHEGNAASNA